MSNNQPPEVVCTVCGKYGRNITLSGQRCSEKVNDKRCKGVYRSAVCEGDWETCSCCEGTRYVNNSRCESCQGSGFVFVRKN